MVLGSVHHLELSVLQGDGQKAQQLDKDTNVAVDGNTLDYNVDVGKKYDKAVNYNAMLLFVTTYCSTKILSTALFIYVSVSLSTLYECSVLCLWLYYYVSSNF